MDTSIQILREKKQVMIIQHNNFSETTIFQIIFVFVLLLAGCAGPGMPDARMPRYVPEHAGRFFVASVIDVDAENVAIDIIDSETNDEPEEDEAVVAVDEPVDVVETVSVDNEETVDYAVLSEGSSVVNGEVTEPDVEVQPRAPFSVLRRGDRVNVFLRGIPTPEDISDVVDELGNIKIGLIGSVRVAGLTTAEAEKAIERAFIDGGFYRRIDAIIVAQGDEYFVRGEVQRPGRYPMGGDISLIQALSAAGGYTDYARRSRISIIRGGESLSFNASRIERQRDPDPLIKPGDIIIVNRRVFF